MLSLSKLAQKNLPTFNYTTRITIYDYIEFMSMSWHTVRGVSPYMWNKGLFRAPWPLGGYRHQHWHCWMTCSTVVGYTDWLTVTNLATLLVSVKCYIFLIKTGNNDWHLPLGRHLPQKVSTQRKWSTTGTHHVCHTKWNIPIQLCDSAVQLGDVRYKLWLIFLPTETNTG